MKTIKELMGLEEADKMKGEDPCWDTHQMVGMKMKNGRKVPNCVPKTKAKNEEVEIAEAKVGDTVSFHHELKSAPGSKVKKSGTVEKVDGDVVHVKVKDKYGVKRHQIKMGDLVKEDTELEEASDTKRPPNFTMHPIDRQDYKILRQPKKTPPKDSKEWGRDGGEKKIKEETEQIDEMDKSAPQPGRDGKVSHSTYGSRDRDDKDDYFKGKESLGKRVTAKQAEKDALKILNKQYAKEETEQIDELNKDTVYSYNKKADADIEKKHKSLGQLMRRGDAAGANKAAHQLNKRVAGMERAEKRLNTEEVEQIDEISAEVKQKYLAAATKKHLQQFLGRAPVRDKQELDKRRAAIQKTSKELTGKTHYQEETEVEESKKIPASDKPVDPKDLVVSLKDVPVKKPRGHTQYNPSKEFPGVKALKREETELGESTKLVAKHGDVEVHSLGGTSEGSATSVRKNGKEIATGDYDRYADAYFISHHSFGKGQKSFDSAMDVAKHFSSMKEGVEENFANDFLAMAKNRNPNARISTADQRKKEAEELAKKRTGLKPAHAAPSGNSRPLGDHDPKSGRSYSEEVETAAQVTKHFEKGQSTSSGVPKWVAEPPKKKKKVAEASDAELMGGAVSKPTASGNNPKLADKFMKAFRKMKTPANISCKTVGMISTCEDTEQEFNNMFTEAMKKKPDPSSKQNLKKGEKLSGKQEPITISPEIEKKGVA